jgi:hypothetical protein
MFLIVLSSCISVDVLVAAKVFPPGQLFLEKKNIPRSQRKTIEQLKNTSKKN